MSESLHGRVAIVTGAGKGIGRAVARALARQGVSVVANARTASHVAELAREIGAEGGHCFDVPGDVSVESTAAALAEAARSRFGPCDLLINAAGFQPVVTELETLDPEQWAQALATNLTGAFLTCRAVLPEMKRLRRGRIINVASGLAVHVQPGQAAYSATKAGLLQMSAVLASEVADHGISVNAVHPGIVATELVERLMSAAPDGFAGQMVERLRSLKARGLLITPEECARFLVWLSASSVRSGEFVRIDDPEVAKQVSAHWHSLPQN